LKSSNNFSNLCSGRDLRLGKPGFFFNNPSVPWQLLQAKAMALPVTSVAVTGEMIIIDTKRMEVDIDSMVTNNTHIYSLRSTIPHYNTHLVAMSVVVKP